MIQVPLCEGNCPVHQGDVVRVEVLDAHGDPWGKFWYCEAAVFFDRHRGFEVRPVPDAGASHE